MLSDYELLKEEIQLAENECCIVFDFGCYFPYSNAEVLSFEFQLGMEEYNDVKLNHRYPNRYYSTITRKYGRKLSKLGYPYVMKLDEQHEMPLLLCIKVGIKGQVISLIFPLKLNMTKEKPVCGLAMRYNFDESSFYLVSHEDTGRKSWFAHHWYNDYKEEREMNEYDIILNPPKKIEKTNTLIYGDIIEPLALPLDRFYV